MPRILPVVVCLLVAVAASAEEPEFGPGAPARMLGGLMIIRQGEQTTVSLGGVFFSRRVKLTTATPEGPVVNRFALPSALHSSHAVPLPRSAPAVVWVEIPDEDGLVYLEGALVRSRGTSRSFTSPLLPPNEAIPLNVRAAFKAGNNLLIEEKQVLIQAGETVTVRFDGGRGLSVPLPRKDSEVFPAP